MTVEPFSASTSARVGSRSLYAWLIDRETRLRSRCPTSRRHDHHPADAKPVDEHPKARREERLRQRHLHLTTVTQRAEDPVRLGLIANADGQREALEIQLAAAFAV